MALFEKCFEGGKITVKNMVRENLDKGRTTSFVLLDFVKSPLIISLVAFDSPYFDIGFANQEVCSLRASSPIPPRDCRLNIMNDPMLEKPYVNSVFQSRINDMSVWTFSWLRKTALPERDASGAQLPSDCIARYPKLFAQRRGGFPCLIKFGDFVYRNMNILMVLRPSAFLIGNFCLFLYERVCKYFPWVNWSLRNSVILKNKANGRRRHSGVIGYAFEQFPRRVSFNNLRITQTEGGSVETFTFSPNLVTGASTKTNTGSYSVWLYLKLNIANFANYLYLWLNRRHKIPFHFDIHTSSYIGFYHTCGAM